MDSNASHSPITALSTLNSLRGKRIQSMRALLCVFTIFKWGNSYWIQRLPNAPVKWQWGQELACFGKKCMKGRVRKQKNREIQEAGVKVGGRGQTEHCRGHQAEQANAKSSEGKAERLGSFPP